MNDINIVEKLNLLKKETKKLELMILEYSLYKDKDLSLIISKLMTSFEGIEYCSETPFFSDSDYYIKEKEKTNNPICYSFPKFRSYVKNNNIKYISPNEKICLFGPSGYHNSMTDKTNKIFYIQEFADFLFKKRVEKNLKVINFNMLEEFLQEYLENTKEKQEQRRNNRAKENEQRERERQLKAFKDNCLIDRKSFFDSITNLINSYCDESVISKQEIHEKWERSSQWSVLNLYHKLCIKNENKNFEFEAFIGSDGCFPDEEECAFVNKNQDTTIKFYEVKDKFYEIYKNNELFKIFIDSLEILYDISLIDLLILILLLSLK